MGVQGLWRLLESFGEEVNPEDLEGRRVAIDASLWIAQFSSAPMAEQNTMHKILQGFYLRILKLLYHRIHPVFVFDGKSSMTKMPEQGRRQLKQLVKRRNNIFNKAQKILEAEQAARKTSVDNFKVAPDSSVSCTSGKAEDGEVEIGHTKGSLVGCLKEKVSPTTLQREIQSQREILRKKMNVQDNNVKKWSAEGKAHSNLLRLQVRRRHKPAPLISLEKESEEATHSFLKEASSFMEEKRNQEKVQLQNLLRSSSSSLFIGPRAALKRISNGACQLPCKCKKSLLVSALSAVNCDSNVDKLHTPIITPRYESRKPVKNKEKECDEAEMRIDPCVEFLRRGKRERLSEPDSDSSHENSAKSEISVLSIHSCSSLSSEKTTSVEVCTSFESKTASEVTCDSSSPSWNKSVELEEPLSKTGSEIMNEEMSIHEPFLNAGPLPITRPIAKKQWGGYVPFDLVEIVELLRCFGIPFVLSPGEADAQCALLCRQGLVHAVLTEDSDVVVHGSNIVIRGFFSKQSKKGMIQYKKKSLDRCGLSTTVLVCLAMLLGCDYDEGVDGVGVAHALRIIASSWIPHSVSSPLEVMRRWVGLINAPVSSCWTLGDENMSYAQYLIYKDQHSFWTRLPLHQTFPSEDLVNLFLNPVVNKGVSEEDLGFFPPNWEMIDQFLRFRGLVQDKTAKMKLDMVKKVHDERKMVITLQNSGLEEVRQALPFNRLNKNPFSYELELLHALQVKNK